LSRFHPLLVPRSSLYDAHQDWIGERNVAKAGIIKLVSVLQNPESDVDGHGFEGLPGGSPDLRPSETWGARVPRPRRRFGRRDQIFPPGHCLGFRLQVSIGHEVGAKMKKNTRLDEARVEL
jgi:hypothetical protein